MLRTNNIKNSLNTSSNFLISLQNQDGSWNDPEPEEITRDSLYKQPIVTTAQAIRALLFNLKPEYVSRIQKAVNYCSSVDTEYIQDQIQHERDMEKSEAFFGPARDKMLDLMEKNEQGQNTIIQVEKDGVANIDMGKKKKNNNS